MDAYERVSARVELDRAGQPTVGAVAHISRHSRDDPHEQREPPGIGLTLVQEILAGHGFDYALERTARDTTRFTIVLTAAPMPGRC